MKETPDIAELQQLLQQDLGNLISFEFTLSIEDGPQIDSNVDGEPMVFQVGTGEMLPALEEELVKLESGESKRVVLSPEQAYGPVTTANFKEFPLDSIPEDARNVGRKVTAVSPDGSEIVVDVVRIQEDKVVLDFNHPLAGKTLQFDVKVLDNQKLA